jgi:hypothetical protein
MAKVQLPAPFLNSGDENANTPVLEVVPDWVALTEPDQDMLKATDPTTLPVILLALVVIVILHL